MFRLENGILYSDVFDSFDNIVHGFSTRLCGYSTAPQTSGMNFSYNAGDDRETVLKNADMFAEKISRGRLSVGNCVSTEQIHSSSPRLLSRENRGEGYELKPGIPADGYVTSDKGVLPIVRTADCVPLLLCGRKDDGEPVVCALHAGWKGIVRGIIENGIILMKYLGAKEDTLVCAVGPHICTSHFEVKEDFVKAADSYKGEGYTEKYLEKKDGKMYASLGKMCLNELISSGLDMDRIDVYDGCTFEDGMFYSNRRDGPVRGTMGSGIAIL